MRTILAIAALLAVTACAQEQPAPPRLAQIEQECGYGRKQFIEAWPCISVGYAYPGDDLRKAYIAKGNYVAEQVREGRMSEMEARSVMADAYQQAVTTYEGRRSARAAASAPVDAMVLGSLMNGPAAMPAPQVPRTTICNRVGDTVYCN